MASLISLVACFSTSIRFMCSSQVDSLAPAVQADITKSIAAVQNSLRVAKSVSNNGNKEIIDMCVEVLGYSIGSLKDTSTALKAGKIDDARTMASAAGAFVDKCNDEFQNNPQPALKTALGAAAARSISSVLVDLK